MKGIIQANLIAFVCPIPLRDRIKMGSIHAVHADPAVYSFQEELYTYIVVAAESCLGCKFHFGNYVACMVLGCRCFFLCPPVTRFASAREIRKVYTQFQSCMMVAH